MALLAAGLAGFDGRQVSTASNMERFAVVATEPVGAAITSEFITAGTQAPSLNRKGVLKPIALRGNVKRHEYLSATH